MSTARASSILFAIALTLTACGATGGTPAPGPKPTDPGPVHGTPVDITNPNTSTGSTAPVPTDPKLVYASALEMWRRPIPKGSCAGCHGADFFDLARIGSSDDTIRRRAIGDTATPQEADTLVAAVKLMREGMKLPQENPLEFRPLQPGGKPLPGATGIERDIAFGKQLSSVTPTLMGPRVATLEAAQQSCSELNGINLRQLPTGIIYPLWSSDFFHGKAFGTMNDWVTDAPREPKTAGRAEWLALQNAYLENPTGENFWRMFAKVDALTEALPGTGWGATNFTKEKFKSALLGQHLMREQLKPSSDFARGSLAFSYLERPEWKAIIPFTEIIPGGSLWEVGDQGRTVLGRNKDANNADIPNNVHARLSATGNEFPQFVLPSVPADMNGDEHEEQVRLAWFWIGFTFNPSLNRISGSNSTKVGEYMVGTLIDHYMHMHNTFFTQARLCARGLLPEANYKSGPSFRPDYSYFAGYNREIATWNEPRGQPLPKAQKLEQQALWHQFTANAFRASLILYKDTLDRMDAPALAKEIEWAYPPAKNGNPPVVRVPFGPMARHFACYQPQHAAADTALINAVETKLGGANTGPGTCDANAQQRMAK